MEIVNARVSELMPYSGNAKLHPHEQVDRIARSVEEFGMNDPIAVWVNADGEMEVVEGHGRLMALEKLGVEECPVIVLDNLDDEGRRAYALVHNKLTMNTGFDFEALAEELGQIESLDMGEFGFMADGPMSDDGGFEVRDTSGEISLESFDDGRFEHVCEECGFRFNA